jgi:hypothetical protein
MSEAVKQFLDMHKIKHLPSSPYHPQTNGMVEGMHRMLNHAITTAVSSQRNRWDEFVMKSIFALRVRKHAVTKFSPFRLLFGTEPRIPGDPDPPRQVSAPLTDEEKSRMNLERTAVDLEALGQDRAAAYQRSLAQAQQMRGNSETRQFRFEIGDWVKRRNPNKQKFENSWNGPLVVVEYGFPGTYWLMTPDGVRLSSTVNESQLASWLEQEVERNDLESGLNGRNDVGSGSNGIAPVEEENTDTQIGYLNVDVTLN